MRLKQLAQDGRGIELAPPRAAGSLHCLGARIRVLCAKCIAAVAFVVTLSAADIKTPPWETSQLVIGRDLFRENCAVCHDIDKDKAHSHKFGPSLNHLFKNPVMPLSHAKPNRQYVVVRIKYGGALMPAFAKRLTDSDINTLIDYITSK